MNNQEIINELDNLILLAGSNENVYMQKKLLKIKNSLIEQWNESEAYYEQIKQILN